MLSLHSCLGQQQNNTFRFVLKVILQFSKIIQMWIILIRV